MMFISGKSIGVETDASDEPKWLRLGLLTGTILAFLAQVWVIFNHRFSADEFHFLGLVHEYLRGSLDLSLQTLHVHLFAPLTQLRGTEVEQLIAGRLAMLVFESISVVSLYLLTRTWTAKGAALMAVLAFLAMPLTLQHGASFRTDPLALAPIMGSLALLARARLRTSVVISIGVLGAFALLVTVKVIFFAPAFAGIAAWRVATSSDRFRTAGSIAAIAAVGGVASILIYLLHTSALPAAEAAKSTVLLANAGSVTIATAGFLPAPKFLLMAVGTSPLQVLLIIATTIALIIRLVKGSRQSRWKSLALLGCIAPIACLFFYRNSFPYFIPTISAPAFAAAAWLIEWRKWNPIMLAISGVAMMACASIFLASGLLVRPAEQRATFWAVHQMFPKPVTYLDGSSMIASFPRQGFFMSGWGIAEYRKGPPIFENMLRNHQIPLLLLNSSAFERALGLGESRNGRLHPADDEILRENYISHWGPVWVAGKQVRFDAGQAQITILIPGTYTVEGASITLDGREYPPGATVFLPRGTHRLSGASGSRAVLRWGNRLFRPSRPPPVNLSRGF